MPIEANILLIDDDPDVLTSLHLLFKRSFSSVETEKNSVNISHRINQNRYDLIFLDMNFRKGLNDGNEGLFWLNEIKQAQPDCCVVSMTAYGDVDVAVEAMKRGASDFILKPWDNQRVMKLAEKLIGKRKSSVVAGVSSAEGYKKEKKLSGVNIIGSSDEMHQLKQTVKKIAKTDANVLILGENGTGKDLIAALLHQESKRAAKELVKVDLGALNDNLFESELFGHVKGAFTDAQSDKEGRFEKAEGSSLFLDEIGNLGAPQQAKLLTVLQNRRYSRLGSSNVMEADIRLICATNMPLYKMVDEGSFRQDLLYRINTVELTIPPLRNRPEDITELASFFLERYANKYDRSIACFDKMALQKLKQHKWPGNVRELEHAIERAVILCDQEEIEANDLNLVALSKIEETKEAISLNLNEMERRLILKAVDENQGNISKAAKELGITRNALYRRLEKHGL